MLSAVGRFLRQAIAARDLARVRALLRAGCDLEERDERGDTALHVAAAAGTAEVVTALLEAGARPRALNLAKELPLAAALRAGNREAAAPLLLPEACARRDRDGLTALHRLVTAGDAELLTLALRRGASAGARDHLGRTADELARGLDRTELAELIAAHRGGRRPGRGATRPSSLHDAIARGEPDAVVALLLREGADPNGRNESGRTPLFAAAAADRPEVVRQLLGAGADPRVLDPAGATALHAAGNEELIRLLLAAGAELEARTAAGETPLLRAFATRGYEAMEAFVRCGAALGVTDGAGRTLLHLARRAADAEHLVVRRAHPLDPVDARGLTPLQTAEAEGRDGALLDWFRARGARGTALPALARAARAGVAAEVEALLREGAEPGVLDAEGATPLHHAAASGSEETLRVLLEAGLSPDAPDRRGRRPMDWALAHGRWPAAACLRAAGGWPAALGWSPVHRALYGGEPLRALERALAPEVTPEALDAEGRTSLHVAALVGDAALAKALRAERASPPDPHDWLWGATPLHLAALLGHSDAAAVLIAQGADREARTRHGLRPVDLALSLGRQDLVGRLQPGSGAPPAYAALVEELAAVERRLLALKREHANGGGRGESSLLELIRRLGTP